MLVDARGHLRWLPLLPLGWLVIMLPLRASDLLYKLESLGRLTPVTVTIGLSTTLAIFALTGLIVVRRGNPRSIIAALVVLTFAPNLVLGAGWVELAGMLCGAVLLVFDSPWSWLSYAAFAVADATVHGMLNDSFAIGLADLSTNGTLGLALLAVTRLARLADETAQRRAELATARAQEEVARARHGLRADVGVRLSAIIARADTVVVRDRWADLTTIATSARKALRSAARTTAPPVVRTYPNLAESDRVEVPFGFARAILLGILTCYCLNAVSDVGLIPGGLTTTALVVHAVITPLACTLYLHHGVTRPDGTAPRWWWWTFTLQWVLVVPVAMLFPTLLGMSIALTLLLSAMVVRLPTPWSFITLGLAVTVVVPMSQMLIFGQQPSIRAEIFLYIQTVLGMTVGPLTFYAVDRLPILSRRLHETSDELAHVISTTERLRFARDVHDLLGFHLSAITMNAELAGRTVTTDPERARGLVIDIRSHAEAALVDLRDIESDARLTLADEVAAARTLLEAADVRVVADGVDAQPVTFHADHVLAVVVREAVTNIVRHSTARLCSIGVRHERGSTYLHISNDGAGPITTPAGNGLRNLRERAVEAGGRLTTHLDGETFTLTAELPA